jgi:hypothetical protein
MSFILDEEALRGQSEADLGSELVRVYGAKQFLDLLLVVVVIRECLVELRGGQQVAAEDFLEVHPQFVAPDECSHRHPRAADGWLTPHYALTPRDPSVACHRAH